MIAEVEVLDAVVVLRATGPLETSMQFLTNWPPQVPSYLIASPGEEPVRFVRRWNISPMPGGFGAADRSDHPARAQSLDLGSGHAQERGEDLGGVLTERRRVSPDR